MNRKTSTLEYLVERSAVNDKGGKICPPKWIPNTIQYEVITGSVAYGVSTDMSDQDISGFCIPPKQIIFPHLAGEIPGFGKPKEVFSQYQEHHIADPDGKKSEDAYGEVKGVGYDVTMYSIVKFFQLVMENNPNMVDTLFVPVNCIKYITPIGQMVRDSRRIFLHKGCFHKFKGYAFSQLHKAKIKSPDAGSKRWADIQKHGWDCYDDSQTDFLTARGWLRYDEIQQNDLLACVEPTTGKIVFHPYEQCIDKFYTGPLYTVEPYLSRCVVTEGHKMLVSPMSRSKANGFSTKYNPNKSDWCLMSMRDLLSTRRGRGSQSFWHIRRAGYSNVDDYLVSDDYLRLAGFYLSEGSTDYREGRIKSIRFNQTEKGKAAFFESARSLMGQYNLREHSREKETVWVLHGDIGKQLSQEFGERSELKRLPDWCFQLSRRQADLLWDSVCLGDGTKNAHGEVYYTSSRFLADDLQAVMTLAGINTVVRGPYEFQTSYGKTVMFQVYRSSTASSEHYLNFGRVQDADAPFSEQKTKNALKVEQVQDRRVVCFQVPTGVLITRSQGKIAIQGNCKYGYHLLRLVDEVEQILTTGDLDLQRAREEMKAVRRGEWSLEKMEAYFQEAEGRLQTVYDNSKLPNVPDEAKIKELLLNCLEHHYGSISQAVIIEGTERDLLRQIKEMCEKAGV